ncbi:WhiB family transcriptional regulator [Streptomyces sp. NPDC005863]|uniref:WhiB family transcriptional regulator n=1 Tax=Streptomyces sp. NPDC005863 TaxID=3364735 RepID=UPI0036C73F86
MSRYDWMDSALCAQTDPELFHIDGSGGSYGQANQICAKCPVARACAAFAIAAEEGSAHHSRFGLYGGMSPRKRVEQEDKRPRRETHATILRLHDRGGFDAYQIAELADVDPRTVWRVVANNRDQLGEAA